ncbi:MAG TPA: hypothetical protein DCM68_07155 [Verrucomicrobia bacterium]|nr:hypothetical protein [Verrucomicrobiota bacterium]
METTRQQIAPLTSIRIFAAVLVVIYHYGRNVWPFAEGWLHRVTACSGSSVAFFFFLSGFILAHAYQGYRWQEPGKLKKYYVARIARIYPVYVLALLATFALNLPHVYWDRISVVEAATTLQVHLGLLQAWLPDYVYKLNMPGWSLSVEASFYLLFPLIVPRLMAMRRSVALLLFGLLYVISQAVLGGGARGLIWKDWFFASDTVHHLLMYHPVVYWPVFLMGVLMFRFSAAVPNPRPFSPLLMGLMSVSAIALIAFLSFWAGDILNYAIHVGMLAPLYGVLLFSLCEPRNWLAQLLSVRWLHYLGEASYGVYILQLPVYGIWMCTGVAPAQTELFFYLYLASLLIVSTVLFRWFETPLRRWMRRSFASG